MEDINLWGKALGDGPAGGGGSNVDAATDDCNAQSLNRKARIRAMVANAEREFIDSVNRERIRETAQRGFAIRAA